MQVPADSSFIANAQDITGLAESVLTSIAIIAGGVWAYFKYLKGRTFHERLEPEINGRVEQQNNDSYLIAHVKVSNVGLAKVPISQKGAGLEVLVCSPKAADPEKARELDWKSVAMVPLLEKHGWIEPNETIYDQHLFLLPCVECVAAKLMLHIASEKQQWTSIATVSINQTTS